MNIDDIFKTDAELASEGMVASAFALTKVAYHGSIAGILGNYALTNGFGDSLPFACGAVAIVSGCKAIKNGFSLVGAASYTAKKIGELKSNTRD